MIICIFLKKSQINYIFRSWKYPFTSLKSYSKWPINDRKQQTRQECEDQQLIFVQKLRRNSTSAIFSSYNFSIMMFQSDEMPISNYNLSIVFYIILLLYKWKINNLNSKCFIKLYFFYYCYSHLLLKFLWVFFIFHNVFL